MSGTIRELTREERAAIQKLVENSCANYCREYGCLPLDGGCYMLRKWWTGAYCNYFREAVLPLAPALAASLTGAAVLGMRSCFSCGKDFPMRSNRGLYCPACSERARQRRQRGYMRKKRR
jgi:hypothetical protein